MNRKLKVIIMLFVIISTTLFMYSCGEKNDVSEIFVTGQKTEFLYGEDFSLSQDTIKINLIFKDGRTHEIDISDLVYETETMMKNDFVIIDFTGYDKFTIGEYPVTITYQSNKLIKCQYNAKVVSNNFTQSDYVVSNYDGMYDGKPHSAEITLNIDADIAYGLEQGEYDLNEIPQFTDAGEYVIYFRLQKTGYEPDEEGIATVTIKARELEIIPHDVTITYGQSIIPDEIECEYIGFIEGEDESNLKGSLNVVTDYTAGDETGTYTIEINGYEDGNYIISYQSATLNVIKAEAELDVIISDVRYGNTFEPITQTDSDGEISYRYQVNGTTGWLTGFPKEVGEYNIRVSVTETAHYNSKYIIINEVKIEKAELQIIPHNATIKYGEEYQFGGVKFIGFVYEDSEKSLSGKLEYTTNYNTGDDTGEYDITITGYESDNYEMSYQTGILTVERAENTLALSAENIVYGEQINYTISDANSDGEIVIEYSSDGEEYTITEPKNVGTYTIKVTQKETKNYKETEIIREFDIHQKEVVLEWKNTEFIFDGIEHLPEASITNLVGNDICDIEISGKKVQANENGYVAVAERLNNENYCLPEENTTIFIIYRAEVISPMQTAGKKVYTGEFLISDISGTELYNVYTNKGGVNAGKYPVVLELRDGINYKWKDSGTRYLEMYFEITKATDNEFTYCYSAAYDFGDEAIPPEYTVKYGNENVIIDYRLASEDEYSYTEEVPVNAGSYVVRFRVIETESYNFCMTKCDLLIRKGTVLLEDVIFEGYVGDYLHSIELPKDENGTWSWYEANYEFTQAGSYTTLIVFNPYNRNNFELNSAIQVKLNIRARENKDFNPDDIVITDTKYYYNFNNYNSIKVNLYNEAEGATVSYCISQAGAYNEEPIKFRAIGEYPIYVMVSKEGYNDYYTSAVLEVCDYVAIIYTTEIYGVMKGHELNIDEYYVDVEYNYMMTHGRIQFKEFKITGYDKDRVGDQYLTLSIGPMTFVEILHIYVYEPFTENFKFITSDENGEETEIITNKLADTIFSVDFNTINNFMFSEIQVIMNIADEGTGYLYYDENIELHEGEGTIELPITIYRYATEINYTLIINYNISEFRFALGNTHSEYSEQTDEYIIRDTIEQNFAELTAQYGEIVAIYDTNGKDLSSSLKPEYIYVEEHNKVRVKAEFVLGVYYADITVLTTELPVKEFALNEYRYQIEDVKQSYTFKVEYEEEIQADFTAPEGYYVAHTNSNGEIIWLDETQEKIMIKLPENAENERVEYYFTLCRTKDITDNVQTLEIVLRKDNYIDKFTFTDSYENVYNLDNTDTDPIELYTLIADIDIEMRKGYDYTLYLNGNTVNINNIKDLVFLDTNNEIRLVITDSENQKVYEKVYVVNFYIDLYLSIRDEENNSFVSFDNYYKEAKVNLSSMAIKLSYCEFVSEFEHTIQISRNGVIIQIGDLFAQKAGRTEFVITISVEGYHQLRYIYTLVQE